MNELLADYFITSVAEMEMWGRKLFQSAEGRPIVLLLKGDLGVGKTTFVRGFLQAADHKGIVKSPTFSLVETYDVSSHPIHHFDLYRLNNPAELNAIGWHDFFNAQQTCLIEWPDKAGAQLVTYDICCELTISETQRHMQCYAGSLLGKTILERLNAK
jgi:tRNA threonylcarbamoyladenosine biosynthesis protein TsaE